MKHLSPISQKVSQGLAYASAYTYLQFHAIRAFAQCGGPMPDVEGTPDGGSGATADSVVAVINVVLSFLALIAVVFVIVGGFRIMMAGGNEENVTKGRKTIIYAIIGLAVIFFSRVIVGFFTGEVAGEFN